jgi:hypothetical protein
MNSGPTLGKLPLEEEKEYSESTSRDKKMGDSKMRDLSKNLSKKDNAQDASTTSKKSKMSKKFESGTNV